MTRTRFPDPYEGMSNDELDRHFSQVLVENRQRQRAVSIRFPEELLEAIRELAETMGIPYQTLIKTLLEGDVARLRARLSPRGQVAARSTAAKRQTSQKKTRTGTRAPSSSAKTGSKRRSNPRPKVPA